MGHIWAPRTCSRMKPSSMKGSGWLELTKSIFKKRKNWQVRWQTKQTHIYIRLSSNLFPLQMNWRRTRAKQAGKSLEEIRLRRHHSADSVPERNHQYPTAHQVNRLRWMHSHTVFFVPFNDLNKYRWKHWNEQFICHNPPFCQIWHLPQPFALTFKIVARTLSNCYYG